MTIETILFGDDDKMRLDMLKEAFGDMFKIDTAMKPEEVILKATQQNYDAVITDLNYTPDGKEGFDIIRKVKDKARYVLLYSSDAGDEDVKKMAKEAGAFDAIRKGSSIRDFAEYLKNLK